jgi:hypothetical protein
VQRAEVERLAQAAGLAVPSDVWQFGAELPNLRTESGDIDHDSVSAMVGDILKSRPGLGVMQVSRIGIGRGASSSGSMNRPKVGLSQLLKPMRQ